MSADIAVVRSSEQKRLDPVNIRIRSVCLAVGPSACPTRPPREDQLHAGSHRKTAGGNLGGDRDYRGRPTLSYRKPCAAISSGR